jgi:hypothetical protein
LTIGESSPATSIDLSIDRSTERSIVRSIESVTSDSSAATGLVPFSCPVDEPADLRPAREHQVELGVEPEPQVVEQLEVHRVVTPQRRACLSSGRPIRQGRPRASCAIGPCRLHHELSASSTLSRAFVAQTGPTSTAAPVKQAPSGDTDINPAHRARTPANVTQTIPSGAVVGFHVPGLPRHDRPHTAER